MHSEIELKRLTHRKAKEVSDLHHDVFKDFFLTSLGKSFLEVFYEKVLSHKNEVSIGAFHKGKLIGFAIGADNNSGFYKSILISNSLKMFAVALPNLISKPYNISRLLRSLLSFSGASHKDAPVLLSICVANQLESKGVGKRLLEAFEQELFKRELTELILTTDAVNNHYVNKFYLNNNYICVRSFFQGKREMNLYYKEIKK
ncbi:GNAT family N-acetyltransferase [Pedobacter hiemivivus]|uniref:GNAT family N-acetyltransferase n=1 Tax=Pedobacter hiemivivus TaxID=2530454 RepID=A0A4U1G0G8_9SPHI|nr:GNAT family N-acetyltransferase [Pedobacter hiemivivus]TKC56957.1 GNAT family N-acetyltransferase [Pedobacter hiemivivus]